MDFLDEIIDILERSIMDDSQNTITAGNIIKSGYDSEVDEYRAILQDGHIWLDEYAASLITETGITGLRIKYTKNLGYFIEFSKSQVSKITDSFIQKQSLLQAVRYTTPELSDYESRLFSASEKVSNKEYSVFLDIRNTISLHFDNLYILSRSIAHLDFYSNGAYISHAGRYNTPNIIKSGTTEMFGARHPVIEKNVGDFISNDLKFTQDTFIHLITGPNMGGKSTYLRQNALNIIISHIGYDIPIQKGNILITDKIFSRVGSGDNLYLGQSTFMVEMQEIAYILRNATNKSFIIIDEIGRGTSTYDGMSLAWSILQYIHNQLGSQTLFSTHYHEIIDETYKLKHVANYSVAVGENEENIVFLRKLIPGGIKKSYGIEVAKLAGIPDQVLRDAKETLIDLQKAHNSQLVMFQDSSVVEKFPSDYQHLQEENKQFKYIEQLLSHIDINQTTPLKALEYVSELKQLMKKTK
ncbi:DNA mismatch repair protein MutS [Candidatus Gracilibacteria bacterium]|nr:DNA mismatch repair protein MutS [Candidatus Gracilibacteria bacterium]